MRRNRLLVLALLVLVVGGGWFSLVRANVAIREDYESNLATARDAATRGITRDVVPAYEAALKLKPSWSLQRELLDYLAANESRELYESGLEVAIGGFPDQAWPYEELVRIALDDEDHKSAYAALDRAEKAGVASDGLERTRTEIAYDYTISGTGYVDALPYVDGIAAVVTSGQWRLVDGRGRSLGPVRDGVGPAGDDTVPVVDDEVGPYFVDREGDRSLAATRTDYVRFGPKIGGVFAAQRPDDRWVYLDESFLPIMGDAAFDEAGAFSGGIAPVRVGDVWKVVRRDGTVVVDGLAGVSLDARGSLGGQDRFFGRTADGVRMYASSGEPVGDLVLEDARPFGDSAAAARSGGRWGFVDADGVWRVQPTFDDARSFALGLAPVSVGGLWGYSNAAGTLVIEPAFADATAFTDSGAALVLVAPEKEPDAGAVDDAKPSWMFLQLLRHKG